MGSLRGLCVQLSYAANTLHAEGVRLAYPLIYPRSLNAAPRDEPQPAAECGYETNSDFVFRAAVLAPNALRRTRAASSRWRRD